MNEETLVSNIVFHTKSMECCLWQWDFLSANGCHIPLSLSFSWDFIWLAEFNLDSIWMLHIALLFMPWPQASMYIRIVCLCMFHTYLSLSWPDYFVISMTLFCVVFTSAWTLLDRSRTFLSLLLVLTQQVCIMNEWTTEGINTLPFVPHVAEFWLWFAQHVTRAKS